jgi:hypothetical protein
MAFYHRIRLPVYSMQLHTQKGSSYIQRYASRSGRPLHALLGGTTQQSGIRKRNYTRHEVQKAVTITITDVWGVTPYSLTDIC